MPISSLPEHKIGVFVLFWGLEPLFSGFSSTKSRFLCAFCLRNPCFRAFRAQNPGFCALLESGTLVFGVFEHKIGVFVRFRPSEPPFSGILSTKSGLLCACYRKSGVWKQKSAQIFCFCALLIYYSGFTAAVVAAGALPPKRCRRSVAAEALLPKRCRRGVAAEETAPAAYFTSS